MRTPPAGSAASTSAICSTVWSTVISTFRAGSIRRFRLTNCGDARRSTRPRKRPTAAAIVDRFKAKGIDPEGYTLYSYAAFQIWAQAVAKAGTLDSKKVAETIRAGKWNTVLGQIGYDKKGDITVLDYVWYIWGKDGKYAEVPAGST